MNKNELVSAIADEADLSKAQAENALNATMDAITKTLAAGGQVSLVGFGNFSSKKRAARTGRNPQTGKTIEIKEAVIAGFKAGKKLKDACNAP